MQERQQLKLDSFFTEKFFDYNTIDTFDKVDVDLPESAETLQAFFSSEKGIKYKQAFGNKIDELIEWSNKNGLDTTGLVRFKTIYLTYSASDIEQNNRHLPFYRDGIGILSGLVRLVKLDSISLDVRKDTIKNLASSLTVCTPGVYTNLVDAYISLMGYVNLPSMLMSYRQKIAKQFVLEKLKLFKVEKSLELHYVNGVLNRFSDAIGIKMIEDEYVNLCNATIIEKLFKSFREDISKYISPENIIESIIQELNLVNIPQLFLEPGGIARFEKKIDFYGLEKEKNFYHPKAIVSMNEDEDAFQLGWNAYHIIYASLLERLRNGEYLTTANREEYQFPTLNTTLYYFPERTLNMAYSEDNGQYKPFLPYCMDVFLSNDSLKAQELIEFIQLIFTDKQRFEIVETLIRYLNITPNKALIDILVHILPRVYEDKILADAAQNKQVDIYKKIFAKKYAHLNEMDKKHLLSKFLFSAVDRGSSADVYTLLAAGADPNFIQENKGCNSLHLAVQKNNKDIVKVLLKAKHIDVNQVDKNGQTALHLAAVSGFEEMIKVLVRAKNIDVNKRDYNGRTALLLAHKRRCPLGDQEAYDSKENCIKALLDKIDLSNLKNYADPSVKDYEGDSVMRVYSHLINDDICYPRVKFQAEVEKFISKIRHIMSWEKETPRYQAIKKFNSRTAGMKTVSEFKPLFYPFQELVELAENLRVISSRYQPSNLHRIAALNSLQKDIDAAYTAYAEGGDIQVILASLKVNASILKEFAAADHAQQGTFRLFGTKSTLAKEIEDAMSRSVPSKFRAYKH